MNTRSLAVICAVTLLLSCSSSTAPRSAGVITAKAVDPSGDTYGTLPVQWDLTALTLTRDTGGIDFAVDFSATVVPGSTGDSDAVYGEIDFDTDQSATTGTTSYVDLFGPGSSGMGVDYVLDMFDYKGDTVPVLKYNASDSTFSPTGTAVLTFSGSRISGRILRGALGGDDGFVNAAIIVGTLREPTDIAPNSGHLKLGGTAPAPPAGNGVAALRVASGHRSWRRIRTNHF